MVVASAHADACAGEPVRPRSRGFSFRLVRGPVPHVLETFELTPATDGTELLYTCELGTDLWQLGQWWAGRVAPPWERTVDSLQAIKAEAERRAGKRVIS